MRVKHSGRTSVMALLRLGSDDSMVAFDAMYHLAIVILLSGQVVHSQGFTAVIYYFCNILFGFLVLSQMERNAAAGRTFGSIPVATPPPVTSPSVSHTKSAASFQNRGRGQGFGVESGSSHTLHAYEDNNRSAHTEAKPTESTEAFPLKSSAGHNVMPTAQGEKISFYSFTLHECYCS